MRFKKSFLVVLMISKNITNNIFTYIIRNIT